MIDWSQALDIDRAHDNFRQDLRGDWYHDPWGWPEISWVVHSEATLVDARLNATGTMRCVRVDVPKANYILRPATLLDSLDRLIYQAIVDQLSKQLIGELPSFAYGWRLGRLEPEAGRYLPNSKEWNKYRERLRWLSSEYPVGLTTDIVSFFASVSLDTLLEDLSDVQRSNRVTERLGDLLRSWAARNQRSGLPQRCKASSVLAHFFIRPIDDLLTARTRPRTARRQRAGPGACRWMDDIWIFGPSESKLRSIQLAISLRLEARGLHVNAAKTKLMEGEDLQAKAKELELGYIDYRLERHDDSAPLEALVEQVLAAPTTTPRTKIRFLITRLNMHGRDDLMEQLTERPERMPHVADTLAEMFNGSGIWKNLQEWYVKYSSSEWGQMDWSRYQFFRMFPSRERPTAFLTELLVEDLESGRTPPIMVPVAAQRLAVWDPAVARDLLRVVAKRSDHPFELRALAYAGLACGVRRTEVRGWLDRFPETEIVSRFLIDRDWRPPTVNADFP